MHAKPGLRAGFSACEIIVPVITAVIRLEPMERPRFQRLLYVVLALLSVAIVIVNALPEFRIYPLISLLCSVPLVILGLAAVFTNIRAALVGITAIAVCISIWTSNWPVAARFSISRGQFESLADEVRDGKSVPPPLWVGLYRIQQIETRKTGAICFWTDVSPSGCSGILNCSEAKMNFNIWNHIPFSCEWRFIAED